MIRRRIALGAVLLFACLPASAQIKLQHSMFREIPAGETLPHFILSLQDYRSGSVTSHDVFHDYLFTQSLRGSIPITEDDSTIDSLRVEGNRTAQDTVRAAKSPALAMVLSAVAPGAGQIYVHRYITIPIIWGFGYYFTSAWITQNNHYKQYRDQFAESVKKDSTGRGDSQLQSIRDFYRDDRDKFAFYIGITYLLNIIDAYVGASLYSFDVSDNLGGSAAIRIRIPIR